MVSSLADLATDVCGVRSAERGDQVVMEELADGQAQVLPRSDVHHDARTAPTGLRV